MVEIGSSVLRSPFVLGGSDDFQGNHTRGYETMTLMDMVLRAYLKTNKYVHAPGHHAALLNTWTSSQDGRSHMCTHSSLSSDAPEKLINVNFVPSNQTTDTCLLFLMEAFERAAPQNGKFSQVDFCSNKHLSSVFQVH